MSDDNTLSSYMCSLPTEILLNIFIYLGPRTLTKCREVCVRWASIIDGLARRDDLWSRYCKKEFSDLYQVARKKAKPELLWSTLYRSLALWPKLAASREVIDEFSAASCLDEEIRNFEILESGVIGVLKKGSIVYYDIDNLQVSKRGSIKGEYLRYTENEHVLIILSYHLQLFLIKKALFNINEEESSVTFDNVKIYTLTDDALYFVNLDEEVYVCNLNDKKLQAVFIKRSEDGVMSLGYTGQLNLLTFQRNIYSVENNNIVLKYSLEQHSNLLHQLRKYNFLEQLDWRIYFQWMYVLNHSIPEGPLRHIIIIRPYGHIYFVGSNRGVLRIYYAPYTAGIFDIFNSEPLKQFNFMERSDCPVLSMCPILQVDVMEVEDGHKVFVAMPKKIAVLNFTHNFKRTASVAMLPYDDLHIVKCSKVDACK